MNESSVRGASTSRWLYPYLYRLRSRWRDMRRLAEPSTHRADGMWHEALSFVSILAVLPLRLPETVTFVIEGAGRATTKSAIMRDALVAAGVDAEAVILTRQPKSLDVARKLLRTLARLPRALGVFISLRRKGRLERRERLAVAALDAFTRWFGRHPHVWTLVNSDVGPVQALLAVGAARAGNMSVWWQDDYHHTTVPSLGFTHGVALNEAGGIAFAKQFPHGLVYGRRDPGKHLVVRSVSDDVDVIGVVVNNLFRGTAEEFGRIRDGMACFGAVEVHLRLHPNSRLSFEEGSVGEWLVTAPRTESMEAFAERMTLVLAGNTAAQLRLLTLGTPVVHVAGLDRLGYDVYGYVARSIVFGEPRLQPSPVKRVNAFYGAPDHRTRLAGIISPTQFPTIEEFVQDCGANPVQQVAARDSRGSGSRTAP